MAKVVETQEERLIPQSGKYTSSIFGNTMTMVVFILVIGIGFLVLWGILTLILAVQEFSLVADQGFPDQAYELDALGEKILDDSGNPKPLDYMGWVRWSFTGFIMAFVLYFPTRWLFRTYGRQSITITDEGILVKKFPRFKSFTSWEGVLDVTVKESESLFNLLIPNAKQIVIYTMDQSIKIEDITLTNASEVGGRLKAFGDSLEERVIDFGYGEQLSVIWRRLKRSRVGVLGFFLVVFFISISIFAAAIVVVNPINTLSAQLQTRTLFGFWNPNFVNMGDANLPPSTSHVFGTDGSGRDIMSRLLFGAFYSILIGVVATVITVVIGAFVGSTSGYVGGVTDNIVQRVTEVLNSMPGLPILLLVSASFAPFFTAINIEGAYYLVVFAIFAFISWGGIARVVRSEVLSLKNSEFIQAEIVLGATHFRIIKNHILPNAMSTILIYFTLGIAGNIIGVATLSYLGFGSASTLVWGKDLSDAILNLPTEHWWGPTFISAALFLLVLGFNLMGDSLRDALDPTLKH